MTLSIKKESFLTLITFLFLTHGAVYFFFPEDVHDASSHFKYIKYILILFFIFLTVTQNFLSKAIYFLSFIPLGLYYFLVNSEPDFVGFISYMLPVYILFSIYHIRIINWKAIVVLTIWVTSLFGFFEVLFLDNHFYMYNRNFAEYRMVSIFLNPNNLGIVITLLTFAYLEFFSKNRIVSWLYFLNGFLIVVFSGSKTGLGIFIFFSLYSLYVAFTHGRKKSDLIRPSHLKYLALASPIIIVAGIRLFSNVDPAKMRTLDWETLMIRFADYTQFFSLVDENFVFPWMETTKNIDNMYLHIWGSFGLPGIILFLIFNVFLILKVRSEKLVIILVSFLLMGVTTNFVYLWPIGYLYWGVVSFCFTKEHSLNGIRFLNALSLEKGTIQS